MGLLSKARDSCVSERPSFSNKEDASVQTPLDEMGKALLERLKLLPQQKSTPYTVLSLLKAYGTFQTGLCLSLNDGIYYSYASLGLGTEQIAIPYGEIWPRGKTGKNYFRRDTSENNLTQWVFPLDDRIIVILGVSSSEAGTVFEPNPVSIILEAVAQKIIPPEDLPQRQNAEATPEEKINRFNQAHPEFNCILLGIPAGTESGDIVTFCRKVTDMIGIAGTIVPLASGRPLILLSQTMDRELIAHRLSKILNARPLLSFHADTTENVLNHLQSLA